MLGKAFSEPPNRLASMELVSESVYGPSHVQSGYRGQAASRLELPGLRFDQEDPNRLNYWSELNTQMVKYMIPSE